MLHFAYFRGTLAASVGRDAELAMTTEAIATGKSTSAGVTQDVSRAEFDDLAARVAATELTAARHDEFVRQDEFRLFKWVAVLAVVSLFGGIGVLYKMTSQLQVDVERGFGQVQVRLERGLGEVNQRLGRVETRLDGVDARLERVERRLYDAGVGGPSR